MKQLILRFIVFKIIPRLCKGYSVKLIRDNYTDTLILSFKND